MMPSPIPIKETLTWAGRLILAGVFLYAGALKASASEEFLLALLPFTFLPVSLLTPISVGLPWLEILTGVLILIPRTSRIGSWLAIALLSAFVVVLSWALSQGIVVACSCFGKDEAPSVLKMLMAILRDAALIIVAFWLILSRKSRTPE